MNRFPYGFGFQIDRTRFLILTFAFLAVTILGCRQGGISIVSLDIRLQNADSAFDAAEIMAVRDEAPKKMEKNRKQQQEFYDKAIKLYSEVIERDTKGKYAQRAHYQIAKIYKRRYDWDNATEHYQAIVALEPTGYYTNQANSGMANIRKQREVIKVKRAEYQNYKAIYDSSPTDETFNMAAEALYEVARAYESLENYTEAIRNYERFVEEFPEHSKAPQAQFQVGNVYFYTLYDYLGGWSTYVDVTEKFPDSDEARQARTLLKQTTDILTEINFLKDEIDKYRTKKPVENQKTGRKITPVDMWIEGYGDQVVQNFQQIASNWRKLRNYPRAINAYKTLARDLAHKRFAAAAALFRTGELFQENGDYERAIEAYESLLENSPNSPESIWQNEAIYQQGVCYRSMGEFEAAAERFKIYMNITKPIHLENRTPLQKH